MTGGFEPLVQVWNPYVTSSPITQMKGHATAVTHIMVNSQRETIVSISKDKVGGWQEAGGGREAGHAWVGGDFLPSVQGVRKWASPLGVVVVVEEAVLGDGLDCCNPLCGVAAEWDQMWVKQHSCKVRQV